MSVLLLLKSNRPLPSMATSYILTTSLTRFSCVLYSIYIQYTYTVHASDKRMRRTDIYPWPKLIGVFPIILRLLTAAVVAHHAAIIYSDALPLGFVPQTSRFLPRDAMHPRY